MGEHIDTRNLRRKKDLKENAADNLARKRRVTFKNYIRELEEDLLDQDLENADEGLSVGRDDSNDPWDK